MRYLLDTHALLWFDGAPKKLSQKVLDELLNEENQLYLSHASLWEMQIKHQLGKLKLGSEAISVKEYTILLVFSSIFGVTTVVTYWAMRLLLRLEDERKSSAIWYILFRQSPELKKLIDSQQTINDLQLLDIQPKHIYAGNKLPSHHRDPFDRMLISQAITEQMTLVTIDEKIQLYQDQISWV